MVPKTDKFINKFHRTDNVSKDGYCIQEWIMFTRTDHVDKDEEFFGTDNVYKVDYVYKEG